MNKKILKAEKFQDEELVLELIGVVDVDMAAKETKLALLEEFFTSGHPRVNFKLKPAKIESIKLKNKTSVFGIFIPFKDNNKTSSRFLPEREYVSEYKKKYPFIYMNNDWKDWSDVLNEFSEEKNRDS